MKPHIKLSAPLGWPHLHHVHNSEALLDYHGETVVIWT